jgi:hypothetical protein
LSIASVRRKYRSSTQTGASYQTCEHRTCKEHFQLCGVDASGKAILKKMLGRSNVMPFFSAHAPCLVGMKACGSIIEATNSWYLDKRFASCREGLRGIPVDADRRFTAALSSDRTVDHGWP